MRLPSLQIVIVIGYITNLRLITTCPWAEKIEVFEFPDITQKMEMDESQSPTAYRHNSQDAISDSSTNLSHKSFHKRPWSDECHDNSDEQDTLMSGDDSLSSCCSILEVRPLKRLRIQDNQSQRATSDTRKAQHFTNKPQYVIRSVISDDVSISTPTIITESQTPHPSVNIHPPSPWSEISSDKEVSIRPKQDRIHFGVVPIKEGSASVGCDLRNTTKIQESNEYSEFNRVLGNLHMQRRNHPLAAVRQNNIICATKNSLSSRGPESVRDDLSTRNNGVLQKGQMQCHQRQTKNKPNWKRQIRLQSNSQLY